MSRPAAGVAGAARLRAARPADAAAMARVMRAAVRAAAAAYPPRAAAAWGSLPALYHRWAMLAGGETRLVATLGGRVVGFAGWRGREVTALFVHPGVAGRGLGARLLAAAEAGAARSGARALTVVAARGAVAFYRRHGWRDAGGARSPLPGGLHLPARRLARRVRRARAAVRTSRPTAGPGGERRAASSSPRLTPPAARPP